MVALALTGCGGVMGEEAEDEPLLTLDGTLQTTASSDLGHSDRLRAVLHWVTWPKPVVDCLVQGTARGGLANCQRLSPNSSFYHPGVEVQVDGRFPNTFSMPLRRLPEPVALMGEAGSRLGVADVLAYVDGNGNRKFDRVPTEAYSSPDIVIGLQDGYQPDAQEHSSIVYREGALHPLFYKMFPSCPEIPQGYSVLTVRTLDDSEECSLKTRKVDLDIRLESFQALQELACVQPNFPALMDMVRASTQGQPPPGSSRHCGTFLYSVSRQEQVLYVNHHPGRFCTAANTVVYTLRDYLDGTWDDRASPPSWWPCPVTAP
ncbi:hypothetical protein LXT21_22145 [Myxococcus sp. K38C18041901]|uniref:hypothetical protein n=1 Tax=Myxococcus guangdongensis TaxID=2906760 RepID=UPI0020A7624D|nr:hypothetical protein [Myxococcus guangdongensis]MCP3061490.1 hypothetical protein [Myxococcus guangdongensis]